MSSSSSSSRQLEHARQLKDKGFGEELAQSIADLAPMLKHPQILGRGHRAWEEGDLEGIQGDMERAGSVLAAIQELSKTTTRVTPMVRVLAILPIVCIEEMLKISQDKDPRLTQVVAKHDSLRQETWWKSTRASVMQMLDQNVFEVVPWSLLCALPVWPFEERNNRFTVQGHAPTLQVTHPHTHPHTPLHHSTPLTIRPHEPPLTIRPHSLFDPTHSPFDPTHCSTPLTVRGERDFRREERRGEERERETHLQAVIHGLGHGSVELLRAFGCDNCRHGTSDGSDGHVPVWCVVCGVWCVVCGVQGGSRLSLQFALGHYVEGHSKTVLGV
jgi:hypothetical protein